jgi:hypothetical protein
MRRVSLACFVWCSAATFGCSTAYDFYASCPNPDFSHRDADGTLDPCGGEGALCAGGCVAPAPYDWTWPGVVWIGDPAEAPVCPDGAPKLMWSGFANPNPPGGCGTCRCEPSTGSCKLPTAFTAHAAPLCQATATATSFNAPPMWDGSCTNANAIPGAQPCPPNNVPCVQSLSIAPLAIQQATCAAIVDEPPAPVAPSLPWRTLGQACFGHGRDNCPGGNWCLNIAARNGFRQCIWRDGVHECDDPAATGTTGRVSPYTEKFVFYQRYTDKRGCLPCECGTPLGDMCTAQLALYSNAGCAGVPFWSNPVTSGGCIDIMPAGIALTSKEATEPIYTPGTCRPFGGDPIGSVVGDDPITACCMPLP